MYIFIFVVFWHMQLYVLLHHMIFRLYLYILNGVFSFLSSTPVLAFSIDVVFILSIPMYQINSSCRNVQICLINWIPIADCVQEAYVPQICCYKVHKCPPKSSLETIQHNVSTLVIALVDDDKGYGLCTRDHRLKLVWSKFNQNKSK